MSFVRAKKTNISSNRVEEEHYDSDKFFKSCFVNTDLYSSTHRPGYKIDKDGKEEHYASDEFFKSCFVYSRLSSLSKPGQIVDLDVTGQRRGQSKVNVHETSKQLLLKQHLDLVKLSMARTKQTARDDTGKQKQGKKATFKKRKNRGGGGFGRAQAFRRQWWNDEDNWGRSPFRWRNAGYNPWDSDSSDDGIDTDTVQRMLGLGPSSSQASYHDNLDDNEVMGHNDLDDEICYGTVRGNIVGIQYYRGTVNKNEMVALEREPTNKYDINAIRVKNVGNVQVGHIKRELAKPLAFIMDKNLARLEGLVPFGASNMYSMSVELTLWGKPEKQQEAVDKLKYHGFYLTGGTIPGIISGASGSQAGAAYAMAAVQPRRTFLTPAEVKDEMDKLFENIEEGDKTSLAEPATAISTKLYPHQKQALNWMIKRENSSTLPPFWKETNNKKYFNSVLNYTSDRKPESVRGGILADDMGLGKTLEMITLIVTNFTGNQPLATPVVGLYRQSKEERLAIKKSQCLPTSDSVSTMSSRSHKKVVLKIEKGVSMSCHKAGQPHPLLAPLSSLDNIEPLNSLDNIEQPELPSLPEEAYLSTPDVSDDDDDTESIASVGDRAMIKKDDPNFSPALKSTRAKENVPTDGRRPRRSAKRPARYNYSSEEDEVINEETPKKKVKEEPVVKGKGKGAAKGKSIVKGSKGKKSLNMKAVDDTSVKHVDAVHQTVVKTEESKSETTDQVTVPDLAGDNEGKTDTAASTEPQITTPYVAPTEQATDTTKTQETKLKFENLDPEVKDEMDKMNSRIHELERMLAASQSTQGATAEVKSVKVKVKTEVETVKVKSEVKCIESGPKAINVKSEDVVSINSSQSSDIQFELPDLDICSKQSVPDLPDLPSLTPPETPTPGMSSSDTVVITDYSKPSTRELGPTSGRTPTTGPRGTLIVCPLSVLSNWLGQLEDHVDRHVHLSIYLYYGSSRTKDSRQLENQDVVITTYSTLSADYKKGNKNPMKKVKWLRIVLDEGHTIKNPNAQQTKAILELEAERKWVLTGTPIQNSMKDLWSLINFLKVNPFTDKQWWRRTIERPLEKGDNSALKRIQHLMCHLALRRTKTQEVNGKPIVELPARNVYLEHVTFTEEERGVYTAMQSEGKLIVSKYFKQGTLLHHYGDVLAILMRLRQLCCHPFLVAKAAAAIKDTIAEIDQNGGVINEELRQKLIGTLIMVLSSGTDEECAICLDSLKAPVITHCAHVFCKPCIDAVINNEKPQPKCPLCRGSIDTDKLLEVPPQELQQDHGESGEVTTDTWKSSTKTDALMNALLKVRSEDPRVKSIVVSQFTSLLTLIEIPLRANGFSFVRLDGTMNTKARTRAIEEFSDPSVGSPTIILLSLKAGGVGINLTAASRVFLMDPAWNPASEEQCFDRCHRLGQTKDVIITKFIVEDSVEERMMELQEKKRRLMAGAFGVKQTADQKRQNRIKDIKTLLDL